MDKLMGTLDAILLETNISQPLSAAVAVDTKETFKTWRRDMATRFRAIHTLIDRRDAQIADRIEAVALSQSIRQSITVAAEILKTESEAYKMRVSEFRPKYKTKVTDAEREWLDTTKLNADILISVSHDLEECVRHSNARFGVLIMPTSSDTAIPGALPVVDDPRFQSLQARDVELDNVLDSIHGKVTKLKEIAQGMTATLDHQQDVTIELRTGVDDTNVTMQTINSRLKSVLGKLSGCSNIIPIFILVCLLLGLCGLIYNIVIKRK
jgi:hypothetical protein